MGDLGERGDGPSWMQRRHFVNEDADGIALGDKAGDETLSYLVEALLKGFALASFGAVGHVRASSKERVYSTWASGYA